MLTIAKLTCLLPTSTENSAAFPGKTPKNSFALRRARLRSFSDLGLSFSDFFLR